jgi:hypothetical protein
MSSHLSRIWKQFVLPGYLMFCLLAVVAQPQSGNVRPVKLSVQTPNAVVAVGSRVGVEVVLQNTNNQPVKAAKDFALEIEIRQPSRKIEKTPAIIKTGESGVKFQTQLSELGLVEIRAKHRELLESSAFLNVKSSAVMKSKPSFKPPPKPTLKPKLKTDSSVSPFTAINVDFGVDRVTSRFQLASLITISAQKPLPAASPDLTAQGLTLCCNYSRRFLADGKDAARIQLVLDNRALEEAHVQLTSSSGKLTPEKVVIPRGEFSGEALLTNDHPGVVTVGVQSSWPGVQVNGEKNLRVSFAPPITVLALKVSPPKIFQVDRSDLIVSLNDEKNRTVITDERRDISLAVESGNGEIQPKVITIQPGQYEGRASFSPSQSGKAIISATTSNLAPALDDLEVDRCTVLFICSCLGGLLGGLLAFWSLSLKWWRLPTGAVTGMVLYWGIIFAPLSLLSRAAIINFWGAVVISIIGGWLGTEVFSMLLRRFGLAPAQNVSGA